MAWNWPKGWGVCAVDERVGEGQLIKTFEGQTIPACVLDTRHSILGFNASSAGFQSCFCSGIFLLYLHLFL